MHICACAYAIVCYRMLYRIALPSYAFDIPTQKTTQAFLEPEEGAWPPTFVLNNFLLCTCDTILIIDNTFYFFIYIPLLLFHQDHVHRWIARKNTVK